MSEPTRRAMQVRERIRLSMLGEGTTALFWFSHVGRHERRQFEEYVRSGLPRAHMSFRWRGAHLRVVVSTVEDRKQAARAIARIILRDQAMMKQFHVSILALTLAWVAGRLAGTRRATSRQTWLADLASASELGDRLGRRAEIVMGLGFLWAAARMRVGDLVAPLWRVLDWWLATDARVAATCAMLAAVLTNRLWMDGGLLAVVENGEGLGVLVAGVWGAAAVLRKVRGIKVRQRSPNS